MTLDIRHPKKHDKIHQTRQHISISSRVVKHKQGLDSKAVSAAQSNINGAGEESAFEWILFFIYFFLNFVIIYGFGKIH